MPETAPRGAQTETDYYFIRRLPPGVAGARIPVQHSREQRRLVGWCAHPCQQPRGENCLCDGEGRCLRPIMIGAYGAHGKRGHRCARCEGLVGGGRR